MDNNRSTFVTGSTDELVEQFTPLVRSIAGRISRLTNNNVPWDDLVQSGFVGLLEAAQRFQPSPRCSLKTFVGKRIRGAIFDEVRKTFPTSRGVVRFRREQKQALNRLEADKNQPVTDETVAKEMGLTTERYRTWKQYPTLRLVSIPDESEQCDPRLILASPDNPAVKEENRRMLAMLDKALNELPERELWVMNKSFEGLEQVEIGRQFGMSVDGIKQMKHRSRARIREALCPELQA